MNTVTPYARIIAPHERFENGLLIDFGISLLRHVEWCARISHRSEDAQTEDSWRRLLESVVLQHGDWSVTEHASITVEALVDRGITHEWVRHRIGAYTQESTRFVNYAKRITPSFVEPRFEELLNEPALSVVQRAFEGAIDAAETTYLLLLDHGCSPQIARSVFPNALASKLIVTYNLRSWRHFFLMRTSKEAHPQMREVTVPLLEEFKRTVPLLYDDIEPGARQVENLRKAR